MKRCYESGVATKDVTCAGAPLSHSPRRMEMEHGANRRYYEVLCTRNSDRHAVVGTPEQRCRCAETRVVRSASRPRESAESEVEENRDPVYSVAG